jgi:signal transduction histidine kinase
VQESLTKAMRHAGASRVQIDVTERDGSLDVVVTDDGRGFDVDARFTGFGLTGKRERVKLAAGTLEIQARPTERRCTPVSPCARGRRRWRDGKGAAR